MALFREESSPAENELTVLLSPARSVEQGMILRNPAQDSPRCLQRKTTLGPHRWVQLYNQDEVDRPRSLTRELPCFMKSSTDWR
jgi:hypothetical protein